MGEVLTRRDFLKRGSAFTFTVPIFCSTLPLMSCKDREKEKMEKRREKFHPKAFRKVIIIGVDGLDPHLLQGLFSKGRCPNMREMAEAGSFRRLATSNPPQSPVAWASMATGTNPGGHGIFDFITRHPSRYLPDLAILKPNRSNLLGRRDGDFLPVRKGSTFWDILSEEGIFCTVLRWPMNFPPEGKGIHLLSGLGVPDIKGGLGR